MFTNRGGRVKSWVLKKYTDDKGGQLELVNTAASEKYGYPLSLWTYDETLRDKLNSALYVTSGPSESAQQGWGTRRLRQKSSLTIDDGDVSVQKSYKFDRDSYVVGVRTVGDRRARRSRPFPCGRPDSAPI